LPRIEARSPDRLTRTPELRMRDFKPRDIIVPCTQPTPRMTVLQVREPSPMGNLRHADTAPPHRNAGLFFEVGEVWPTEPRTLY
jgi:hypothetical protein